MSVPREADAIMTAAAFLRWRITQSSDRRCELFDGAIIEMAAERAIHARTKAAVFRHLERLIAEGKLPCEAFPDGMAVRVNDANVFEPDAMVRCGPPLGDQVVLVEDPVIVVEVASPSTQRADALIKFARYFRNAHIRHYLVVLPAERIVLHHVRRPDGRIETASYEGGTIALDEPPLMLSVPELFSAIVSGEAPEGASAQ